MTYRGLAPNLIRYNHYSSALGVYSLDDMRAISKMHQVIYSKLSKKLRKEALEKSAADGHFGPSVILLFILVRKYTSSEVMETGVGQGISTCNIMKTLKLDGIGHLLSIDH